MLIRCTPDLKGQAYRSARILRVTYFVAALVTLLALGVQQAATTRTFKTVINLETTSEDSANVSMGDLDGDGDLDLVLAKGRHTPILDRVLLNDGKGGFIASDLGPTADRTYTAALADSTATATSTCSPATTRPTRSSCT